MRFYLCRFSKAIERHFTVPSPRFSPHEFLTALITIAEQYEIDYIIPNFEEIFYLAKGIEHFPSRCTVFSPSYPLLNTLHNKWLFNQAIDKWGFNTPQTRLVSSKEELRSHPLQTPYLLKPCYSRAALHVVRVKESNPPPSIPVEPYNPWIAQEYLSGKKFCSHTICHQGKITSHVVYPVDFAINESSSLNFETVDHPLIFDWVTRFAACTQLTGQIGIDFIETAEGGLYAIECNPRGTSGLHLFKKQDCLPDAFFNSCAAPLLLPAGRKRQISLAMATYGWKSVGPERSFGAFLKKLVLTRDVVFSPKDLKPWLYQLFLYPPYLWKSMTLRKSLPAMFTFDLDWNGEEIDIGR